MSPFTDRERDLVQQAHAKGKGRNQISRETGIHQKRVSAIAAELGLSFARGGARTAVATEARKADAASRRARIEEQALASAEKLLAQMWSPSKVYNFGGRENDYNEVEHAEPPFADKRAIATAVQALAATALKIAEHDRADTATSGVDAWLEHMTEDGDDE